MGFDPYVIVGVCRRIQGVLFYSARTAEIFLELLGTNTHCLNTLHAVCLSTQVAQSLNKSAWRQVHVADQPTHAAMLETLAKVLPPVHSF
jgi:uroporphyrinogen-III synthase